MNLHSLTSNIRQINRPETVKTCHHHQPSFCYHVPYVNLNLSPLSDISASLQTCRQTDRHITNCTNGSGVWGTVLRWHSDGAVDYGQISDARLSLQVLIGLHYSWWVGAVLTIFGGQKQYFVGPTTYRLSPRFLCR